MKFGVRETSPVTAGVQRSDPPMTWVDADRDDLEVCTGYDGPPQITKLKACLKRGFDDTGTWFVRKQECKRTKVPLLVCSRLRDSDDPDFRWEVCKFPIQDIRSSSETRRREKLLRDAGFHQESAALKACTSRAFRLAQENGFPDLIGHPPSTRVRTAFHREAGAAAMGTNGSRGKRTGAVPKDVKRFITIPIVIHHDLRAMPRSGRGSIAEAMAVFEENFRIALREAGAVSWYLCRFDEVAEHDPNFRWTQPANIHHKNWLKAKERVNKTINAFKARHWSAWDRKHKADSQVFVIHAHMWLAAHDGHGWMNDQRVEVALRKHFDLPYQVAVSRRRKRNSAQGAMYAIGYANKAPGAMSDALIVQDVHFRVLRTAAACWQEGVFRFSDKPLPDSVLLLLLRRNRLLKEWPSGFGRWRVATLPVPDGSLPHWPVLPAMWKTMVIKFRPALTTDPTSKPEPDTHQAHPPVLRRLAVLGRQSQGPPARGCLM